MADAAAFDVPWDEIASDERFQRLTPEGQRAARARWQSARTDAFLEEPDSPARTKPAGWIDQLPEHDESGIRDRLAGLTTQQREDAIGLATGRLRRSPEGEVSDRLPAPTGMERFAEDVAPAFQGAAHVQQAVYGPFEHAGEHVRAGLAPYVGDTAAGIAGGVVGSIPDMAALTAAELFGGRGGRQVAQDELQTSRIARAAERLREASPMGARGLGLAGRTGRTAAQFGALEGEKEGARAIADDDQDVMQASTHDNALRYAGAAAEGAAGGALAHLTLGEALPAVLGYAAGPVKRLAARLLGHDVELPPDAPSADAGAKADETAATEAAAGGADAATSEPPESRADRLARVRARIYADAENAPTPPPEPRGRADFYVGPEGPRSTIDATRPPITVHNAAEAEVPGASGEEVPPADGEAGAAAAGAPGTGEDPSQLPPEAQEALRVADEAEARGQTAAAQAWRQMASDMATRAAVPTPDFVVAPGGEVVRPDQGFTPPAVVPGQAPRDLTTERPFASAGPFESPYGPTPGGEPTVDQARATWDTQRGALFPPSLPGKTVDVTPGGTTLPAVVPPRPPAPLPGDSSDPLRSVAARLADVHGPPPVRPAPTEPRLALPAPNTPGTLFGTPAGDVVAGSPDVRPEFGAPGAPRITPGAGTPLAVQPPGGFPQLTGPTQPGAQPMIGTPGGDVALGGTEARPGLRTPGTSAPDALPPPMPPAPGPTQIAGLPVTQEVTGLSDGTRVFEVSGEGGQPRYFTADGREIMTLTPPAPLDPGAGAGAAPQPPGGPPPGPSEPPAGTAPAGGAPPAPDVPPAPGGVSAGERGGSRAQGAGERGSSAVRPAPIKRSEAVAIEEGKPHLVSDDQLQAALTRVDDDLTRVSGTPEEGSYKAERSILRDELARRQTAAAGAGAKPAEPGEAGGGAEKPTRKGPGAEASFAATLRERGLDADAATRVFDYYRKNGMLTLDKVNGRYVVKHGAMLDEDALAFVAKITAEKAADAGPTATKAEAKAINPAGKLPATEVEGKGARTLPELPVEPGLHSEEVRDAHTPDGPTMPVRFEVRDARDLVASHLPDNVGLPEEPNPSYPQAFQPRERDSAGSRAQVQKMAGELQGVRLAESPMAGNGAPIISPEGVVLSGNGRVLALRKAIADGLESYAGYKKWLVENAKRLGLDPSQIERMERPVLVRRQMAPLSPEDTLKFVERANARDELEPNASERARMDARQLTPDLMEKLSVPENGDLLAAGNMQFLRGFIDRAVTGNERGTFFLENGKDVSQAGLARVRNAILARVFDREPAAAALLERMVESTDDNVKAMSNGILEAAPELARLRAQIDDGARVNRDVTGVLAKAVERVSALRDQKITLEDYLKQDDIFGRDANVDEMIRAIASVKATKKGVANILKQFVDIVDEQGDLKQAEAMTGRTLKPEDVPPLRELIAEASRRARDEPDGQSTLFGGNKARRAGGDKLAHAAEVSLEAQIRAAEANGDAVLEKDLRAKLDLLRASGGLKPEFHGPGAAGVAEMLGRAGEVVQHATGRPLDARIVEQRNDDYPSILTYLGTQGFVFRKVPVFQNMVRELWKAIDDGGWLHRILVEDRWRRIDASVPKAERELFTRLAWESSEVLERGMTQAELKARGLSDASIQAYGQMQKLMKDALRLVINPLRKRMNLERLDPRGDFYLPHRFTGAYDVYIDGQRAFRPNGASAKTLQEAYGWAKELLDSDVVGKDAAVEIRPRFKEFLSEFPDTAEHRALAALLNRLEQSGTVTADQVRAAYDAGAPIRGFPKHFEYRKGQWGFDEQILGENGIVDRYLAQLSRWAPLRLASRNLGAMLDTDEARARPHLHDAMTRLIARVSGKPGMAEVVLDDLIRRVPGIGYLIDPTRPSIRAARTARMVTSHLKLGLGNVSAGIVNSIQFITHVTPVVGLRTATKAAGMALFPDETAMRFITRWEKRGFIEPMFVRGELAGSMSPVRRATDTLFLPMTIAEKFNRRAALLAAMYHLRGTDKAFAFVDDLPMVESRFAEAMLRHVDYPSAGKAGALYARPAVPEGMTTARAAEIEQTLRGLATRTDRLDESRLVKLSTDFAASKLTEATDKAITNLAARVSDLTNFRYDAASRPAWTTGPIGELVGQFKTFGVATVELEKRLWDLARKEGDWTPLAGHAGAILATSGILGMPFAYAIDRLYHGITGISPIASLLARQDIPRWAVRGLPVLVGADIHRRVGMGDVVPDVGGDHPLVELAGPTVSTLTDLSTSLWKGDFDQAARRTAQGPGALYSAFKDWTDGYSRELSSADRRRFTPDGMDLTWRMLGVQPEKQSEVTDLTRVYREKSDHLKAQRQGYIADAATARGKGDNRRVFQVLAEARHAGVAVTYNDVLREQAKRKQSALDRLRTSVPKALRPELNRDIATTEDRLRSRLTGGR